VAVSLTIVALLWERWRKSRARQLFWRRYRKARRELTRGTSGVLRALVDGVAKGEQRLKEKEWEEAWDENGGMNAEELERWLD
jgi:hypothetical protein